MTGLHLVRKALKKGDRWYVYAWRGGPCIHTEDGRQPVITHEILAKQQQIMSTRYREAVDSLNGLIRDFEDSPAFRSLAQATKVDRKLWLTRASERFGATPLKVFNDRRMRGEIITWRNLWQEQPRTADKASEIMTLLLGFGVENGRLDVNVASGIKKLYSSNRSELIWEDEHWGAFMAAEPPAHLVTALNLAQWTGLRLSDLVQLTWAEVNLLKKAIIRFTNKGRRRNTRAVIPILDPLMEWIGTIPEAERIGTVLKNSRGKPWTASGLETVFQKKKPEGFERTIHDLRGTFCTFLILKGFTDSQCAMIMGWTSEQIAALRARYVDEERVILSMIEKLSA